MNTIDEIEKITNHMYIIRKPDGTLCGSNLMIGNILYDIGDRLQQHGKFLMHTSRVFNLKCAEIAIAQKKQDEDDIEVLAVLQPKSVQVVSENVNNKIDTVEDKRDQIEPIGKTEARNVNTFDNYTDESEHAMIKEAKNVNTYNNDTPPGDLSFQTEKATRQKLCARCNKKFTRKENLQEHLNRHVGITFQCAKCNEVFYSPQRHADHFRVHKGGLKCEKCGKAFSTSSKLTMHKKFHESKKYLCRVAKCTSAFVLKSDRNQHENDHNPGGYYTCDTCHKKFTTKTSVKSHVSLHRRMEKH